MYVLVRKLAESVWPPNLSLYASSTCVACNYLRVHLAGALGSLGTLVI